MNRETRDEILARARRYDLMEEARIERLLKKPKGNRPNVGRISKIAALLVALRLRPRVRPEV